MLADFTAIVRSDLVNYAALTSLLSNGINGVRPLIAVGEDGDKFITYYIRYNGAESKDMAQNYQVVLRCWAATYDESIAIADQVSNAFASSNHYYNTVSSEPIYNTEKEIYTEQIFNIKK